MKTLECKAEMLKCIDICKDCSLALRCLECETNIANDSLLDLSKEMKKLPRFSILRRSIPWIFWFSILAILIWSLL